MKMKSLLLTIFGFVIVSMAIGQSQIDPFSKEYQILKASGQIEQPAQNNYAGEYPKVSPSDTKSGLLIPLDGSFSVALVANDDGYTDEMTLPFDFTFYGDLISNFYINNNGNISFGSPYSTYTATGFPVDDFPMLAPFWGDVDTRGSGSGLVHYRMEPNRLVVIWDEVGYYDSHDDLLNTFELIVTDGTDPTIGIGNNVAFCYDDMQWTTGDASDGSGGFGGVPATVGINKGDGATFALIGRFDHPGTDYDGPGGENDGVSYLDNKCFFFNTGVQFNNIPPVAQGMPAVQPIELMVGDIYNLTLSFLSPEETQITDAVVNTFGLSDFSYTVTPGNVCTVEMDLLATADNLGLHQIEIIATDDGIPPESTTVNLEFLVTSLDPVINVNPTSLSESLFPDEASTQMFTISNTGDAELTFDLEDVETSKRLKIKSMKKTTKGDFSDDYLNFLNDLLEKAPKSVTEVEWLSENPLSGTLQPGEEIQIEVGFDAAGLDPDIYSAQILVNSNDPVNPQIVVAVTLEVMSANCSYLTTIDNENNALEGIPDGDLDDYLCNDSPLVPIEFNIFVDEPVVESAQLSIYGWDIDETGEAPNGGYPEVDEVYVNGNYVGNLTGADGEFSTSVFNVDPSFLNPGPNGQNLIQIYVSVLGPYWCVEIDWGQIIVNNCMGGNAWIRYVDLNKSVYMQGEDVELTVEVDTDIPSQDIIIETNLLDENMINVAGTSNMITIQTDEDEPLTQALTLPANATLGATYHAQVIVYDANTFLQQDIALAPFLIWDGSGLCMDSGWQIISSWLEPSEPALEIVMNDLINNSTLVFMLNNDGIFWPSQNINTIGSWDSHSGYKIKMAAYDCLTIDGEMVEDKTVLINSGVQFMPVLSDVPVPAVDIFSQLDDALLYAFDIQDQLVYWPEGGIFTLQTLEPGRGYLVNMLEEGTVTFPENAKATSSNQPVIIENAPWAVDQTGVQHLISVESNALADFETGDIIGVFNLEGSCTGMAQITNPSENLALVVWGNDITTEEIDGMQAEEMMKVVVYSAKAGEQQQVMPVWNTNMPQTGQFAENGLSMISGFKSITSIYENDLENLSIYPNPNAGVFNIEGINGKVDIQLVNSTGQMIHRVGSDQDTQIDISTYPKGVYYLKIVSGSNIRMEKVILN